MTSSKKGIVQKNPTVVVKNSGNKKNQECKLDQLEKFNKLVSVLQISKDQNFTGYIKINYTQGSIGRIEKFEEILKG